MNYMIVYTVRPIIAVNVCVPYVQSITINDRKINDHVVCGN